MQNTVIGTPSRLNIGLRLDKSDLGPLYVVRAWWIRKTYTKSFTAHITPFYTDYEWNGYTVYQNWKKGFKVEFNTDRIDNNQCTCWVGHGSCGGCSGVIGITHEPSCGYEYNPDCPEHGEN